MALDLRRDHVPNAGCVCVGQLCTMPKSLSHFQAPPSVQRLAVRLIGIGRALCAFPMWGDARNCPLHYVKMANMWTRLVSFACAVGRLFLWVNVTEWPLSLAFHPPTCNFVLHGISLSMLLVCWSCCFFHWTLLQVVGVGWRPGNDASQFTPKCLIIQTYSTMVFVAFVLS